MIKCWWMNWDQLGNLVVCCYRSYSYRSKQARLTELFFRHWLESKFLNISVLVGIKVTKKKKSTFTRNVALEEVCSKKFTSWDIIGLPSYFKFSIWGYLFSSCTKKKKKGKRRGRRQETFSLLHSKCFPKETLKIVPALYRTDMQHRTPPEYWAFLQHAFNLTSICCWTNVS